MHLSYAAANRLPLSMVKIKPVNLVVFSVQNLPMLLLTRLRCLLLPRLLSHLFDGLSAVTDDADQDTSDETVIQWRSHSTVLTIPVIIMNPHPIPKITLLLLLNQYARVSVTAICLLSLLYIMCMMLFFLLLHFFLKTFCTTYLMYNVMINVTSVQPIECACVYHLVCKSHFQTLEIY